jgi:hypothetical protein
MGMDTPETQLARGEAQSVGFATMVQRSAQLGK